MLEIKKEKMPGKEAEEVESTKKSETNLSIEVSTEKMKSARAKTNEEFKSDAETTKKNAPEANRSSREMKSGTKSMTEKKSHDTNNSAKELSSVVKSSTERESAETNVSQKEVTSEKKISVKQLADSKTKKESSENSSMTERAESSAEFPKLKTYSKEGSTDRESSPRKEPKPLSAWKKDSPKLDWTIKIEPLETTLSSRKEADVLKSTRLEEVVINTEEQAWDMLLNEPEKRVLNISPQSTASDKSDESKTKSKKNRKIKKSQDDTQNKSEDDSFVEIHAIEEKAQLSSELVSISLPFEEIESACSFSSKTKKSRSPKNTIEKEQCRPKLDDWSLEDIDSAVQLTSADKNFATGIQPASEHDSKPKFEELDTERVDCIEVECSDTTNIENIVAKESSKDKKPKSVASSQEYRKPTEKSLELDVKDVYVIDTTKDEFPEIQITAGRGSKMRKKCSQVDRGNEDIEVIPEKPIKSWSSIAAGRSSKKAEEDQRPLETITAAKEVDRSEDDTVTIGIEKKRKANKYGEDEEPLSLHEELMRLCKRTDIMVAQCDTPSGLHFVEEHHSLSHDLAPLELDFGLDDFRLEVMRDSLLDVEDVRSSSPICKIDIDSILSSIKESTSAFNLIDLEKVPDKREKGFSVVEVDKYTSEEVKADDESKCGDRETEKSSDEENASGAPSTDSDKEDRRAAAQRARPATRARRPRKKKK